MAIAFGSNVRGAAFSAGSSLSWTGPTVSGTNTIAIVQIGAANGSTPVISGVTWGGVAMVEATAANTSMGGQDRTTIYYLVNPPTGASTVVISTSVPFTTIFASAAYFTGVHQSSPVGSATTSANTGDTALSATVTTTVNGDYIVSSMVQDNQNARAVPVGTGAVEITAGSSAFPMVWSAGYFPVPTAGSTTVTHDSSTGVANRILGVLVLHPATPKLFSQPSMDGMSAGGPFFSNPLG